MRYYVLCALNIKVKSYCSFAMQAKSYNAILYVVIEMDQKCKTVHFLGA